MAQKLTALINKVRDRMRPAQVYSTLAGSDSGSSKEEKLPRVRFLAVQEPAARNGVPAASRRRERILCALILPLVVMAATFLSLLAISILSPGHRASSPSPYDETVHSVRAAEYKDIMSPAVRERLLSPIKWEPHTPSPCGHSPRTAREAGCIFGPTTWSWYPAACYDFALEAEFLNAGDWTWYGDESMSESSKLVKENVLKGDHKVAWMTREYHELHCVFAQRKLLRAVLQVGGALPDNYALGMAHLEHCEEVEREALEKVKGSAKYLDCVSL